MTPYLCWCPEMGEAREHAVAIDALTAQHAAKARMQSFNDEGDYTDDGDGLAVVVEDNRGRRSKWRAFAKTTVHYSAREETL